MLSSLASTRDSAEVKSEKMNFLNQMILDLKAGRNVAQIEVLKLKVVESVTVFKLNKTSSDANRKVMSSLSLLLQSMTQNSDSRARVVGWMRDFSRLFPLQAGERLGEL